MSGCKVGVCLLIALSSGAWKKELDSAVLLNQRSGGTFCRYHGSWDPIDPWSPEGGRVYATAIICTSLLAATRYERTPPN